MLEYDSIDVSGGIDIKMHQKMWYLSSLLFFR